MTIKDLCIMDIQARDGFLMRDGLDKALVAQYKENLKDIIAAAPILVYETSTGYILADGFHRLAAARQLSWDDIRAQVIPGSGNDAYAAACLANLQHGKPLNRKERKRAICEYLKLKVKLSNRVIAQEVGVSHVTILRYRRELEANGEIEPQDERLGKDEKIRSTVTNVTVTTAMPEIVEPEPDPFDEWFTSHVVCGDALKIMPTIERKFDLAIVDPPYGITTEDWDLTNKHELLVFTRRWLNQVIALLKPTGRLFVFWSREYMFELKPLFDEIVQAYPLHYGGMIVWNFRNVQSMPDSRKRYKLGWEPVFYYYGLEAPELHFAPTEITGKKWKGEEQSDVWVFPIPQSNFQEDKRTHPTQKPRALYERIVRTSTFAGAAILDPFAGAGTTGHASLLTGGRDFYLVERNPKYVQQIYERLKPVWEAE